jgi:hypothetical protein
MGPFTSGGKFAVANLKKNLRRPSNRFSLVYGRFLMGFWKKWGVGRGFLMVNSW